MFVHNFVPLDPPPSQPAQWGISSWISIRRASNRIANTQPKLRTNLQKLRTNRIMNKRAFLIKRADFRRISSTLYLAIRAVLQRVPFTGVQDLKVEKTHFATWKKGPENRKDEVKLRPPLCRPLKHSMSVRGRGHEDSNFSIFRGRRFTAWPGPLHWIAFPVEILTKPSFTEMPPPFSLKKPFFWLRSASSHPLPQNRL